MKHQIAIDLHGLHAPDLSRLPRLSFLTDLRKKGANCFFVGGVVRDMLLNRPSKDFDILVTGVSVTDLIVILGNYGKVDLVGVSFGILKFREFGAKPNEDFDIAVPRREKKIGEGHQGFEVELGEKITMREDMFRRDFTINSLAMSPEGEIIDYYGGISDLRLGQIRMVNPLAFQEDPLRMMRAIQFASRFGFEIEDETYQRIKESVPSIREVSGERILGEIDKMVLKSGDLFKGVLLLKRTQLWFEISGDSPLFEQSWGSVRTSAEFVFLMLSRGIIKRDEFWLKILRGTLDGARMIRALEFEQDNYNSENGFRWVAHKMLHITEEVMDSKLVNNFTTSAFKEFRSGYMPGKISDMKVNGHDLIVLGIEGKAIGEALNKLLLAIYREECPNEKEALLAYLDGQ